MSVDSRVNLSDEELAVLAAEGDDESMALLIAKITPVAKARANAYAGPRLSEEDLIQEGMLGFLDAVKGYAPEKGSSFKAYAEACIKNRILSAVRVSYNNKNAALTSAVSIEDKTSELLSGKDDPANILSAKFGSEQLENLIRSGLSDFEKKVINLRLLDKSYSEIASVLGCSEKAVDNALRRIRKKIRSET